ncbi:MAG: hypothetical protein IT422_16270 [Pirellulaceae bacterium]|nr:hypothetical protein [Pirellulaceae bacterium]
MPTGSSGLRRRWHLRQPPATITCGCQPHSIALSSAVDWHSTINPAPACAYLAGTPALILSQAHRANTP